MEVADLSIFSAYLLNVLSICYLTLSLYDPPHAVNIIQDNVPLKQLSVFSIHKSDFEFVIFFVTISLK